MNESTVKLSVIIPNWNGMKWLPACLEALSNQSFTDFETILVDNNSQDESLSYVEKHYPQIRIIALDSNTGFSGAVNRGVRASQAEFVVLVNTDTIADRDWLTYLTQTMIQSDHTVCSVSSCMVQMANPTLIDDAGDELSWQGGAYKRGHGESVSLYQKPVDVFSACAGAALYRREILLEIGGFDERFFAYLEDVDVGFRSLLRGYRNVYSPKAIIQHYGHGSETPQSQYVRLITRNRLLLLYKNMPLPLFMKKLPKFIYGQIIFFLLYKQPLSSLAGYLDFLKEIPYVMKARKDNVNSRTITCKELERYFIDGLKERRPLYTRFLGLLQQQKHKKIIYHVTAPPPPIKGTDALFQEIEALSNQFGGTINYLNPSKKPGIFRPRYFGFHNLPMVKLKERITHCHHVIASELHYFPVFTLYKNPIIYSVVCSVRHQEKPTYNLNTCFSHIVVTNSRDHQTLLHWGANNVSVVRPGIDVSRFSFQPPVEDGSFSILIASAPWMREQFHAKGFESLFKVATEIPELRLILLWRGLLKNELHDRLVHYNLLQRTTVINQYTDVNSLLSRVHATFVLAASVLVVKSYPHSLMESIAAGKPVGVSSCIAMSDDIRDNKLGVVVSNLQPETVKESILELLDNYRRYQDNILCFDKSFFSIETMLKKYKRIYNAVGNFRPGV